MLRNEITEAAELIGGEPSKLKAALQSLINTDSISAPCVEPNALAAAYPLKNLLRGTEHQSLSEIGELAVWLALFGPCL